ARHARAICACERAAGAQYLPGHVVDRRRAPACAFPFPICMTRRRVVVTGLGLISPCGMGAEESWQSIVAGRSGIGPITLFDSSVLATRFAGEVKGFVPEQFMDRKQARRVDRYQQFALAAAEMAMRDSGFTVEGRDACRAAVVVGTCVGGLG